MYEDFSNILGLGTEAPGAWQMAVRALTIYVTAITLVRLGEKRFMGKNTAFDMILGIILGSVLSRAITGNSPFFPTIVAAAMLVGLHWMFSHASYHSHWFGRLIKGSNRLLIQDGEVLWENMRKSHITEHDLMSTLYTTGRVTRPGDVKTARLERNGNISVVPRDNTKEPRVIEIKVEDGVQTVRIEGL